MAERLPPLAAGIQHTAPPASLQPATTAEEGRKDPVFLVMFTGQIESAEASPLSHSSDSRIFFYPLTLAHLDHKPYLINSFQNLMSSTATTAMYTARIGMWCL